MCERAVTPLAEPLIRADIPLRGLRLNSFR